MDVKELPRLNKPNAQPVSVNEVAKGVNLGVDFGDGLRNFRVTKIETFVDTDDDGNETTMYTLHSGGWMIQVPDGQSMTRVGPPL